MFSSHKIQRLLTVAGLLALLSPWSAGSAATLTSDNFSFGYGFTNTDPATWNTNETASVNTSTTQGDFSFSPAVSGGNFGSIGVEFPDRVLANGVDPVLRYSASSGTFGVSLTASWSGDPPGDAEPDPNYELRLVITQISIYAAGIASQSTTDIAFSETTAGNMATSPSIDVNLLETAPATEFQTASNWKQLSWDPNDFWLDGTTSTRTFELIASENRGADGFEVFGYVELAYTAIPEPGGIALAIGLAAIGILIVRRRS